MRFYTLFLNFTKMLYFLILKNMIFFLPALAFFQNCVEPNDDDSSDNPYLNTLSSMSVGDGSIGAADDYFYDFNDAIDAKFFKYSNLSILSILIFIEAFKFGLFNNSESSKSINKDSF